MSKRGSSNAQRFAGQNWGKNVGKVSVVSAIQKKRKKELEKKLRKERRIAKQFKSLFDKFKLTLSDENISTYGQIQNKFCKNCKPSVRIKILEGVQKFKSYCEENNVDFSIEEYFDSKIQKKIRDGEPL